MDNGTLSEYSQSLETIPVFTIFTIPAYHLHIPPFKLDEQFVNHLLEVIICKHESLLEFIEKIQKTQESKKTLAGGERMTARQRALLAIFNDEKIQRGGDNNLYNHYIALCITSNRTGYANESWSKAKKLLSDYKAILPLLNAPVRKRAENEIFIIKANRS